MGRSSTLQDLAKKYKSVDTDDINVNSINLIAHVLYNVLKEDVPDNYKGKIPSVAQEALLGMRSNLSDKLYEYSKSKGVLKSLDSGDTHIFNKDGKDYCRVIFNSVGYKCNQSISTEKKKSFPILPDVDYIKNVFFPSKEMELHFLCFKHVEFHFLYLWSKDYKLKQDLDSGDFTGWFEFDGADKSNLINYCLDNLLDTGFDFNKTRRLVCKKFYNVNSNVVVSFLEQFIERYPKLFEFINSTVLEIENSLQWDDLTYPVGRVHRYDAPPVGKGRDFLVMSYTNSVYFIIKKTISEYYSNFKCGIPVILPVDKFIFVLEESKFSTRLKDVNHILNYSGESHSINIQLHRCV